MTYSVNIEDKNFYKLFFFTFSLALLTYGYALTNFTISLDNEIPSLAGLGLDLGRWGQNLIRYHLFDGFLQYFSLALSLFLFSLAAIKFTRLFKFQGISAYFFCGLFVTFPQISYQVVFGMMGDVAGLGVLLSVISVELFLKGFEMESLSKKFALFAVVAFILMFTLSIYQAFIIVPTTIYLLLFFQSTFNDDFKLSSEIKKMMLFAGVVVASMVLYFISVKIICPPIQDSGYLTSFTSGDSNNQFLNFCSIWLKNLVGSFYYGERTFILALLSSFSLFVWFFIDRKFILIRFATLFVLLLLPFIISYFITNGYNPPRIYLTTNLMFAFLIVFTLGHFKISKSSITQTAIILISIINIYFVTKLFYTVNKIYKNDKRIAEKIDNIIQSKYPSFYTTEKPIYFYGYFPYEFHQKFRLDKSEIFGGSIFNWDSGNNYRIVNFFREADVAEYKMINTKEEFDTIKDSINNMPIWPDAESIKMFNNIVVVKLGKDKGMPLYFE
jgi:hypothetical protein